MAGVVVKYRRGPQAEKAAERESTLRAERDLGVALQCPNGETRGPNLVDVRTSGEGREREQRADAKPAEGHPEVQRPREDGATIGRNPESRLPQIDSDANRVKSTKVTVLVREYRCGRDIPNALRVPLVTEKAEKVAAKANEQSGSPWGPSGPKP